MLLSPIVNDKVRLFLDDALVGGLDGEWQNATAAESFPSGDGSPGGDFDFRFNVLRGDATQDGQVNALDLSFIKQRLNKTATNPGSGTAAYSVFADLTSDGSVNALDLSAAKQRLNTRLPGGEPTATALLFGSTTISQRARGGGRWGCACGRMVRSRRAGINKAIGPEGRGSVGRPR